MKFILDGKVTFDEPGCILRASIGHNGALVVSRYHPDYGSQELGGFARWADFRIVSDDVTTDSDSQEKK